jgi:Purine nucleoside phosphorylase
MLQQTTKFLQDRLPGIPGVGVVLGSGLGAFGDQLQDSIEIPYQEIPGWPKSTAIGHAGKLVYGSLEGVNVLCMSGRRTCTKAIHRLA